MKDHYQLAAELLQYRDEYEAKQRKKKLYAVRICAAVLCCGAVLAAAGHAVSRSPKPAETTFTETATENRNIININRVPGVFAAIVTNAFTGTAAIGGFAGCAVSEIIRVGMARSVYSNEAGWGTSPMIHASAKTPHPVEQGLWGSFEVFFDTMVICTITALSVILSGNWTDGTNGGTLALSAFASGFGKFGSILLAVIMVIYTVTTSGGWFTYYLAILEHLYKKEGKMKDIVMKIFYAVRALPGVLWTIYLVKTNNQGFIWTVVDITSAIPTFVNVAVILILSNQYFKLLKDYKARNFGQGTVDKNACLFYEEKTK